MFFVLKMNNGRIGKYLNCVKERHFMSGDICYLLPKIPFKRDQCMIIIHMLYVYCQPAIVFRGWYEHKACHYARRANLLKKKEMRA